MPSKDKIREQIAYGVSPQDVAAYHGISMKVLLRDYKDIVFTAAIDLDVEVARMFYQIAMGAEIGGNMQACINWLKSRCQWDKLKDKAELPTEDKSISKVIIETLQAGIDPDTLDDDDDSE